MIQSCAVPGETGEKSDSVAIAIPFGDLLHLKAIVQWNKNEKVHWKYENYIVKYEYIMQI